MHQRGPVDADPPDHTFMVVALDLLSGITEGLQASVESLVARSQPPLVPLLFECCRVK